MPFGLHSGTWPRVAPVPFLDGQRSRSCPCRRCVRGSGPPCAGCRRGRKEDCGGAPGYSALKMTLADPAHEEHRAILEWLGLPSATEFPLTVSRRTRPTTDF
ncbi:hypothetical protein AB0M87_18275 [Streptomyces sp. NPDC051320]|uniref:IS1096 element passenger TnpR family protein n=1 Tax=Streptomyces sp. NPDC051320 TaxID=3154644 RepID=UPI003428F2E5